MEKKIGLIVDDVELNRAFLRDMLESEYCIIEAKNGMEAIELIRQYQDKIAIVLLDVIMPGLDGFGVLTIMQQEKWIETIPVIMISSETSAEYVEKGYSLGVTDYISRPFSADIIMHRVRNTIILYAKQNMLKSIVEEQIHEREANNSLMVDILSTVVEFRNNESGAHVRRIRVITELLLETLMKYYPEYNVTLYSIIAISNASALHDIGKLAISEEILNKPGKLTKKEFEIMKTHSIKGAEMLENIHTEKLEDLLVYAYDICRWHHERWDGCGYPDGLKGANIPLSAQVVSIADVYDALVSERVYKDAYAPDIAIKMIKSGECGKFNPDILDCLLRISGELEIKIKEYNINHGRLFDIKRMSDELIYQKRAAVSNRTIALLEEERTKYQSFAAISNEILFEYDLSTNILTFTEVGAKALNVPLKINDATQWLEKGLIIEKQHYEKIYEKFKNSSFEQPTFKIQCFAKMEDEEKKWVEITVKTLWIHECEVNLYGCIGKIVDINEQKNREQMLKILAENDSLTQLYNHRTAKIKINKILENKCKAAILFIDMDNFKNVNDTFGHMEGDKVLKQIANVISLSIREGDIGARMGGDEFLVCLNGYEADNNIEMRIQNFWESLQRWLDKENLSLSMGVALYPDDAQDFDKLVTYADEALYASKRRGKHNYTFFDKIEDKNKLLDW